MISVERHGAFVILFTRDGRNVILPSRANFDRLRFLVNAERCNKFGRLKKKTLCFGRRTLVTVPNK